MSVKILSASVVLSAIGALAIASAAYAAPELVSMKQQNKQPSLFPHIMSGGAGGAPKLPVSDSATIPANTSTFIDGWALIDQTTCQQLGMPQPFMTTQDTDDKVTYTSSLIQSTLGDGNCPGQEFTFSGIYATYSGKGMSGATQFNHLTAVFRHIQRNEFGLPKEAKIVDFLAISRQ